MKAKTTIITPAGYPWEIETDPAQDLTGLLAQIAQAESVFQANRFQPPANVEARPAGELEFEAVSLIPDVIKGKVYWNVLGPTPYHKHGVRVWYETLEEAGLPKPGANPTAIQNAQEIDLTGWIAVCEMRDKQDGEGKKPVVVKLIPPTGQPHAAPPPSPPPAAPAPAPAPAPQPQAQAQANGHAGFAMPDPLPMNPTQLLDCVKRLGAGYETPPQLYQVLGRWPKFEEPDQVQWAINELMTA